jgi:hypothetical protein
MTKFINVTNPVVLSKKLLRPGKLHGTPDLSMIILNLKVLGTFGYFKVYLNYANFAA